MLRLRRTFLNCLLPPFFPSVCLMQTCNFDTLKDLCGWSWISTASGAKWVQKNNKHAGATTSTLPNAKWLFLSVRGAQGVMGIVGIPIVGYSVPDAFEKNLMIAILSECGLSQERIRLQEERNQAERQAQPRIAE